MLFADAAKLYVEYLTNPTTQKSAKEHLDRFIAHSGKLKVSEMRVHHITDYLKTKKWADSTKATAVSRITSCLNYAVAEGYLEEHKVKFPKGRKPRYERRKPVITAEHQDKLEQAAKPPLRAILRALRASGCRPSELCNARIEQVDLKKRVMLVPNKVARKTGEKLRPVYMSEAMLAIVREAMGARKEGFVFLNAFGNQWKPPTITHRVRKIRIKLGLPEGVVAYGYRGKFASDAINNGNVNPALVAHLIGHKDLVMLMRNYYKADPEALLRAVEQASRKE